MIIDERMNIPRTKSGLRLPRLGFLGIGWIGRHRMECIAKSGAAEIAVVADMNPALAREAAERFSSARAVSSLNEMLTGDLDGIVIATPNQLHAGQCIRALNAGCAVFCQKPLARTAAETTGIVEAARKNDCLLSVDFSYRHVEGVRLIYDRIKAGELGDIYAIDLVFHNAYGPDKPWFRDLEQAGGGCVLDLGIHLVDLALWMQSFPTVTKATSRLFSNGVPLSQFDRVEDYAEARIDFDNGATARLACSWNLAAGCDAVIEARFFGTKGGAALRNVNGSFYDFTAEKFTGTQSETLCTPPDEWGGRAVVVWANRLQQNTRFDPEVEGLVQVMHAIDAIYGRGGS